MPPWRTSWHTTAAHYAVVPLPAVAEGRAVWALRRYAGKDVDQITSGTYDACCQCLATIRTAKERGQEP